MGDQQNQDEGLIKKPMKGSVKRVSERMAEEVSEKTPTEAIRDDIGGSSERKDEKEEPLQKRGGEARDPSGDDT